jgi:hypothetical protein
VKIEEGKEKKSAELPLVNQTKTNYVDKMSLILDRLDLEYEEELKKGPKQLVRKNSRISHED